MIEVIRPELDKWEKRTWPKSISVLYLTDRSKFREVEIHKRNDKKIFILGTFKSVVSFDNKRSIIGEVTQSVRKHLLLLYYYHKSLDIKMNYLIVNILIS